MLPLLSGLLAGGFQLASGLGARQSAKSAQKRQAAEEMMARNQNTDQINRANVINTALGRELLATPETVKERTKGSVTNTSYSQNSVDIAGMMAAAEAAGFNPLTFLRNGGLQAYLRNESKNVTDTDMTVTTTRKGHNAVAAFQMMMPQLDLRTPGQVTQVPSMLEVAGKAGSAAFNAYNTEQTRLEAQDFQRALLDKTLEATQYGTPNSRSFYVPGFSTSGPTVTRGPQGGGLSIKPGDREYTSPWPRTGVDPTLPDAEQAESRYGDIAQEIFGLRNLLGDLYFGITGKTSTQQWDDLQKWYDGLSWKNPRNPWGTRFNPDTAIGGKGAWFN